MKLSAKHLLAAFSMLTVMAIAPTSAFAGGSVHLDVPGFSIGVHDDHKYRKRHRKHYRSRYYDDRRYERRHRRNSNDYYNRRYYNDNYYSSGRRHYRDSYRNYDRRYDRRYDRNSYDRRYDRRAEICPIDGYSARYDRNRSCYEHKDHYHCS